MAITGVDVDPVQRKTLRGSLTVLEDFFGAEISPELVRTSREMPLDQMEELADRLVDAQERLQGAMFGDLAKTGFSISGEDLLLHEGVYFEASESLTIGQVPDLKHWFLYGENLVLPDPIPGWTRALDLVEFDFRDRQVAEAALAEDLTRCLRYLLEVRPLVNTESAVLIPDQDSLRTDSLSPLPLSAYTESDLQLHSLLIEDPCLAATVAGMDLMPSWERSALELDDIGDVSALVERVLDRDHAGVMSRLDEIWRMANPESAYGGGRHAARLRSQALAMAKLQRDLRFRMAPATPVSRAHLLRSTAAVLDGPMALRLADEHLAYAVSIGLPDLSSLSLTDLALLRSDVEVFADVRWALSELARVIHDEAPTGFMELQSTAAEAAQDIVGPVAHELQTQLRRTRLMAKLAEWVASTGLRLTVSGLATAVSGVAGPIVDRAASPLGRAAGTQVARTIKRRHQPRAIALSVLLSTLPPDHDLP